MHIVIADNQNIKAKKIKEIRSILNFTVDDFAQSLKVSLRTVKRWEMEGVNSKQSSRVALLLSLIELMSEPISRKEFIRIKNELSSQHTFSWSSIGIASLSTIVPMFSLLSAGALGVSVSKQLIESLKKVINKKQK